MLIQEESVAYSPVNHPFIKRIYENREPPISETDLDGRIAFLLDDILGNLYGSQEDRAYIIGLANINGNKVSILNMLEKQAVMHCSDPSVKYL